MGKPFKVGLTGGIGSGKSSAAGMFAALGVPVLDLDRVGATVVARGSVGFSRIVEAFGESMLQRDGSLDRAKLAAHCFSSSENTARLNAIMHPLIWQEEQHWLSQQRAPYVIIEASVLLESGGADRMDAIIVVLAHQDLRLNRVLARGDRDEAAFRAIVSRQCSDQQRRQDATYIIENSGSLAHLQAEVVSLHERISATL